MINDVLNSINEYFNFLISEFGFIKEKEEYDDSFFTIIYKSKDIKIRLVSYHREIYLYTASVLDPDDEAAFFNIIDYLQQNNNNNPTYNFYKEINDLYECYKMQVQWLSKEVKEYLPLVISFYNPSEYKNNNKRLLDFVIKRNPEIF